MSWIIRSSGFRAGIAIGAAIAIVGVLMGVAVASIPAGNGTINACYSTTTGALRVIDYPAKHCSGGERLLRWNQTGPAGPAGYVPVSTLQGSPCRLPDGNEATLSVLVDRGGAVTLRCWPTLTIASSFTLSSIIISSASAPNSQIECDNARTCSAAFPPGTPDAHLLVYAASAFAYTCPGSPPTTSFYDVSHTRNAGECWILMSANRSITVTAR